MRFHTSTCPAILGNAYMVSLKDAKPMKRSAYLSDLQSAQPTANIVVVIIILLFVIGSRSISIISSICIQHLTFALICCHSTTVPSSSGSQIMQSRHRHDSCHRHLHPHHDPPCHVADNQTQTHADLQTIIFQSCTIRSIISIPKPYTRSP